MSGNGVDPLYELRPEERKRIDRIKQQGEEMCWSPEAQETEARSAQMAMFFAKKAMEGKDSGWAIAYALLPIGHDLGHLASAVRDISDGGLSITHYDNGIKDGGSNYLLGCAQGLEEIGLALRSIASVMERGE
jgi:hypothetical protein